MFDLNLFEIREEVYRDKGLDLSIELKHNGRYTNLRFNIQLKATATKQPNADGIYSWQIETSNIQYLLNAGIPAYYICYVQQSDTFYFRQLNDFASELTNKLSDWNNQESHTLHVSDVLDKKSITKIYEDVKKRLLAIRELNNKLNGRENISTKKVSVSSGYKITDETSIVDLIEKIGLTIINEGKSKEVILLSEKVSEDITSPLYNLTVGIAAYYTADLFKALTCFQKANRQKEQLSQELVEHLLYFDALVKYSIGFINQAEYDQIINSLRLADNLQYYIKIEQAREKYLENLNEFGFQEYKNDLFIIIDNNEISSNIIFIASCEYLLFWGYKINMEHFQNIALINALEEIGNPNRKLRVECATNWLANNKEWENYYQNLCSEIIERKDFYAFNMCKLNEIKVKFELIVYTSLVKFEKTIPDFPDTISIDNSSQIETILSNIDKISGNYKSLYHIENLIAALSVKYEVLLFVKKKEAAEMVIKEINELLDFHDLKEQKRKIDFLLHGGTTEERIKSLMSITIEKAKADREEYTKLVEEMIVFDKQEEDSRSGRTDNSFICELFPIGHFCVDKDNIDTFYHILNINSYTLHKQLNYFFDHKIIPVLNILNETIIQEGYANGLADDKGIESWRRIRRIREDLYNEKIKRIVIK